MRLAIAIPAHNESTNVDPLVRALLKRYDEQLCEIVIVNDVSSDGTDAVADKLAEEFPRVSVVHRAAPPGVGRALRDGVAAVGPEATHILTIDADFLENIEEIAAVLKPLEEGFDGTVGSRFIERDSLVNYPRGKWLFNRVFHLLARILFQLDRNDFSNNFKAYRREIWEEMKIHSDHFSANAETGLYPPLLGYKIKEVPVHWVQRQAGMGTSSFKLLQVGPAYAKVLWWSLCLRFRKKDDRPTTT